MKSRAAASWNDAVSLPSVSCVHESEAHPLSCSPAVGASCVAPAHASGTTIAAMHASCSGRSTPLFGSSASASIRRTTSFGTSLPFASFFVIVESRRFGDSSGVAICERSTATAGSTCEKKRGACELCAPGAREKNCGIALARSTHPADEDRSEGREERRLGLRHRLGLALPELSHRDLGEERQHLSSATRL